MKLNKSALAYTTAIFFGVSTFLTMAYSLLTGRASDFMARTAALHWASYSWSGAILMTIECAIYGLIIGWAFAWVYNKLTKD